MSDYILQSIWMTARLLLSKDRPDVIVAFSLRVALTIVPSLLMLKNTKIVVYVTGLGLIGIVDDLRTRLVRRLTFALLRAAGRHRNCYFVFENYADSVAIGVNRYDRTRQMLVSGAGVDLTEFAWQALPADETIKLAIVSRLVWSKGVDLAVQAVAELGAEGHSIELNVYGEPDPANPLPCDPRDCANGNYVKFRGFTEDVVGVWARHHAAIFPSRGGEGLPRALLEAAACGRPCIITNVPGCAEFVRNGIEGFIAEAGSVESLKNAIRALLDNKPSLLAMGLAARKRVAESSSREMVERQFEELFATLVAREPSAEGGYKGGDRGMDEGRG
ncbi:glycosyltransferase [Rhodopseudomonas sp. G2_2311]|uniref:glycosyltransferase n=1 Tax=Rhodopseudomonas sp. G2_2311 TaxID=3114287 RepID=UPI0039C6A893